MYTTETILKALKEEYHVYSGKTIDMLEQNIREEVAKGNGARRSQDKALAWFVKDGADRTGYDGYIPYEYGKRKYYTYTNGHALFMTTTDYGYKESEKKYAVGNIASLLNEVVTDAYSVEPHFIDDVTGIRIDEKELETAKRCHERYTINLKFDGDDHYVMYDPNLLLKAIQFSKCEWLHINMAWFKKRKINREGDELNIYNSLSFIVNDCWREIAYVLPCNILDTPQKVNKSEFIDRITVKGA